MIITTHESLLKECDECSIIESYQIIGKLEEELKKSPVKGIGLAANQIGINKKVCIIRAYESIDLVNPEIIDSYDLMEFSREGCLSYPGQTLITKRYNEIVVRDSLHPYGIILTGLIAVVASHEIDHLYGKTMFDSSIIRPQVNEKCWCGSNIKYKKCHMGKEIL